MINLMNYFDRIDSIDIDKLPDTLLTRHKFLVKITKNGYDWRQYKNNNAVKKVLDSYIIKLNKYQSYQREKKKLNTIKKNRKPKSSESKFGNNREQIVSRQHSPHDYQEREISSVNRVEHLKEEIKVIKRYVALHNKTKSPNAILTFIKTLQRSIVQKLIRKTSPLAKEIKLIQSKLIVAYTTMKKEKRIEINPDDLSRLVALAGGQEVYASVRFIKHFVGMQQKNISKEQLKRFIKQLENAVGKKELLKDDPYADKLNEVYKKLKTTPGRISLTQTDLSGLEEIIDACEYNDNHLGKIYNTSGKTLRKCIKKTYSDARRGACSYNGGLNGGVLTAEQMANRKLDLLDFSNEWLSVFGKLGRNFIMMIHGEPYNGKTIFLLKFSKYLAENFGKVLYVSSEEYSSPTMTKKVKEFVTPFPPSLHFAENLADPEISDYQFVIFDSISDLGMKVEDFKKIRKDNPDVAFIFILQHTKDGKFKGGKDWEHLAEIVGEVVKGVFMTTKNRYHHRRLMKFLDDFKSESNLSALPAPYPITE